jgi:hypothetical protein
MAIVITCPSATCGRRYSVPDEAAGRTATCASCGTKIQIGPAEGVQAPPPPAPPHDVFDVPAPRHPPEEAADEPLVSVARQRPAAPPSKGGFADFVLFRKLIAPWVTIVFYWLSVAAVILFGIAVMIAGSFSGDRRPLTIVASIVVGLLIMIVGPFLLRIVYESAIVIFRIYDTLTEIRDSLHK